VALRRKNKRTERSKIDATPPWQTKIREEPPATSGPWDERDAPEDELPRIDLGALRVPVFEGVDVRLEVDEAQQVVAVTLAGPTGTMQLGAFAAPRNEGIWDDVRGEIAESLRSQRGSPREQAAGRFGAELLGTLPADNGRMPVRFVGIDGPRWFLRAMFVGPAALDESAAEPFEQALRQVIVVRGSDPLPAREPIPLRLPKEFALPGEANGTGPMEAPGPLG
jgi:hypothetical protein